MQSFRLGQGCELVIREADITTLALDAIVNAANERMLGGGGVDGAIHRAAGPELLEACKAVAEVRPGVRCPTGEARITPGFRLPAKHVIHTVGPVYRSAAVSAPLLCGAYRSSLELAQKHRLRSLAFPAISCGVFGYPLDEAAEVALATIAEHAGTMNSVQMALFGSDAYEAFVTLAARLFDASRPGERP